MIAKAAIAKMMVEVRFTSRRIQMPQANVEPSRRALLANRLRARLARRYDIICRPIQFGSLCIPFTQIKNPDVVLDEVVAEADRREKLSGQREHEDELHLPYWAELWDSAIGI